MSISPEFSRGYEEDNLAGWVEPLPEEESSSLLSEQAKANNVRLKQQEQEEQEAQLRSFRSLDPDWS